jgi:thiamine biosynthesis protein ThiS
MRIMRAEKPGTYQPTTALSSDVALDMRRRVRVTVNDEPRELPDGATVAELVARLGLGPRRIAVEVNRDVVPRATYGSVALSDGDVVEIIHFVGGG